MSWKTSKGIVSAAARIAKLDVPAIKGSTSSGADERYMTDQDYPAMGRLTEGGYARDLFLEKDLANRRMILTFDESNKEIFDTDMFEKLEGVIDMGYRDGSRRSIEEGKESDYVLVWWNGNWALIDKVEDGGILIPEGVANKIFKSSKYNKVTVFDNFDHVKISEAASLSSCTDIYSEWTYKGVKYCMINTLMKNGPYKFQRKDNTFNIWLNMKVNIHSDIHKPFAIEGVTDINNEILTGFRKWQNGGGGVAKQAFPVDDTVDFDYGSLNVNVEIKWETSMLYYVGIDYYDYLHYDPSDSNNKNLSNVSNKSDWSVANVGKMELFTHAQGDQYSLGKFHAVCGHELGHILGLGDAYLMSQADKAVTEDLHPYEIMNDAKDGDIVSSNDIEMLFMAALKNQKQYFNSDRNRKISEAFLQKQ